MKILIADDSPVTRHLLNSLLVKWGYQIIICSDGGQALKSIESRVSDESPDMAILDWMMPNLDGPTICRLLRQNPRPIPIYTILLTAKTNPNDVVAGFDAGADDFIVKPFNHNELHSRIRSAERIIGLQKSLAQRIKELETAFEQSKKNREEQKLRAVGQLAAGIAHEINTPIQFIGDNTHFLKHSFGALIRLAERYQSLFDEVGAQFKAPEIMDALQRANEEADLRFIHQEIPKAIEQSLEGLDRVATIVRALKDFAHPNQAEKAAADLNQALQCTMTVAGNEINCVADVQTEFLRLPPVQCNLGEINQVFLSMLINAAQAIKQVVGISGQKGLIRLRTVQDGDEVLISISDSGCGISESNKSKIFEPFFTTKEPGQGTGQGLAIARSIVVEKHGGAITFESSIGKGTTFFIRLPIDGTTQPNIACDEAVELCG